MVGVVAVGVGSVDAGLVTVGVNIVATFIVDDVVGGAAGNRKRVGEVPRRRQQVCVCV